MKLAILGGSFNPPHIGHLALAEAVRTELGYDSILFVPAHEPPHKRLAGGASVEDRVSMLESALEGNPFFCIELCEIERGGVSYTIDTVRYLEKKFAPAGLEGKIGVILGDDLLSGFPSWKNAGELALCADLIVARRESESACRTDFPFAHRCVQNAFLPLSSSDIRRRAAEKKSVRYLVPEAVYRYIRTNNLYE